MPKKKYPPLSYLRPTASIGSSSSLMSGWMLGPMALESMLMQVNTVASTCIVFCLLKAEKSDTSIIKALSEQPSSY